MEKSCPRGHGRFLWASEAPSHLHGKEVVEKVVFASFSWEVTNKEPLENSQVERTAGAKNKEFGKVKEEKENQCDFSEVHEKNEK